MPSSQCYGLSFNDIENIVPDLFPVGDIIGDLDNIYRGIPIEESHIPYLFFKQLINFGSFESFRKFNEEVIELKPIKKKLKDLESEINNYLSEKSKSLKNTQELIENSLSLLGNNYLDKDHTLNFFVSCMTERLSPESMIKLWLFSDLTLDYFNNNDSKTKELSKTPFFKMKHILFSLPKLLLGKDENIKSPGCLYERYDYLHKRLAYHKVFQSRNKNNLRRKNIIILDNNINLYKSEIVKTAVYLDEKRENNFHDILYYRINHADMKNKYDNWKHNARSEKGFVSVTHKGRLILDYLKERQTYFEKSFLDLPYEAVETELIYAVLDNKDNDIKLPSLKTLYLFQRIYNIKSDDNQKMRN